jgi:hypothetical protein
MVMSNNSDPRALFAGHARLISRGLEGLMLLSLLAGAIPFALGQPIWWLRLSDSAVNLAPVILLAVILLRLSVLFRASEQIPAIPGSRGFRTASRWALLYALLIPLQIIGFTWLWFDSDRTVTSRILQDERERASLQQALIATRSDNEIQSLLARSNAGPLPSLPAGSLADHKQQLAQAIAANGANLSANLSAERNAMLANSLPGSLRVVLGALIVSGILFTITRQI